MRGESYMYVVCVSFNVLARRHTHTHAHIVNVTKHLSGHFFSFPLPTKFYIGFFSVDHIEFRAHFKSRTIFVVMSKMTHR